MPQPYIPINKGHFELDTAERTERFYRILSMGWEPEYREYRRLWSELPTRREVRDYPLLVDLELSSICNLRCPMCPTTTIDYKKMVKRGLMELDLAKKVIDEVQGKVYALRLSLVGEPTLNPHFLEILSYAKQQGIKEVSFLTNGGKLDIGFFKEIADAGADWITISIDGVGDAYDKIRAPLKFVDMLQKLKDIYRYKQGHGLLKPVIKIQGVWPAIRHNPTEFYETIAPYADLLAYNPLIDYLNKDSEGQILFVEGFSCPQFFQRLVISSDGAVKMCSNDEHRTQIIGNAEQDSVHQIWHGKRLNELRLIHGDINGFKRIAACRHCYYPRKTEASEQAVVGNRVIQIENYLNRPQEIGE